MKFRAADFDGWQTAWAFDIIRGQKGRDRPLGSFAQGVPAHWHPRSAGSPGASTEQVSAATEESSAGAEELAASAHELSATPSALHTSSPGSRRATEPAPFATTPFPGIPPWVRDRKGLT